MAGRDASPTETVDCCDGISVTLVWSRAERAGVDRDDVDSCTERNVSPLWSCAEREEVDTRDRVQGGVTSPVSRRFLTGQSRYNVARICFHSSLPELQMKKVIRCKYAEIAVRRPLAKSVGMPC